MSRILADVSNPGVCEVCQEEILRTTTATEDGEGNGITLRLEFRELCGCGTRIWLPKEGDPAS